MSRQIPYVPGHWLWGNQQQMTQTAFHQFIAEMGWQYGGLVGVRVLHRRFVIVTQADYAQQILNSEAYIRSYHYRIQQSVIGKGLLTTEGEPWRKRRRQIQPLFKLESLKKVVPVFCQATQELLNRWELQRQNHQPVELVSSLKQLGFSAISYSLFSKGMDLETAAQFGQAIYNNNCVIRRRNYAWLPLPFWVPTRDHRSIRQTRSQITQHLKSYIAEHPVEKEQADLLDGLLAIRDPKTGTGLEHQALIDETYTLFLAGVETTVATLTWALYLLMRSPDVAERWYAELDHVLGDRLPTWEDLRKLPYTAQIISETLRLYPTVYHMPRECIVPDQLGDYAIAKGTTLLISAYGIHRDANFWEEPDQFRPERFDRQANFPKQAFLPFASGKHTCLGNHFAVIEMTVILAMIGQRYFLQRVENHPVEANPQLLLVPACSIPVQLSSRRSTAISVDV